MDKHTIPLQFYKHTSLFTLFLCRRPSLPLSDKIDHNTL